LVGCPVGGKERLKILTKSNQCVPTVPVSIFVENCAHQPFYRIEIPSGPHKPYCTSGGTYKIRSGGRNEMLYPGQLLALFLDLDAGEFLSWIQQAAANPGAAAQEAKLRITAKRKHLNQFAWGIESSIKDSLDGLAEAISNGEVGAEAAGVFSERAGECDVRLSSQDLCGFLMRLP